MTKTFFASDILTVTSVPTGKRPHLLVERTDGGVVRVALPEVRILVKALSDGGALAAERSSWQRELRYSVADTLRVIAIPFRRDPHLLVERTDGGLVRVELREVGALIGTIKDAAAFAVERSLCETATDE